MSDPCFDPPCEPPSGPDFGEIDELVPFARKWSKKFTELSNELSRDRQAQRAALLDFREDQARVWMECLDDFAEEAMKMPEYTQDEIQGFIEARETEKADFGG